MTSLDDKRRLSFDLKSSRAGDCGSSGRRDRRAREVVSSRDRQWLGAALLFWAVGLGLGYYVAELPGVGPSLEPGSFTGFSAEADVSGNVSEGEVVSYNVSEDYGVVVVPEDHPEMSGRTGFVRSSEPGILFVQGERSPHSMYSTCSHEWLHWQFLDFGDEYDAHDFIEDYQDGLPVGVCFEFIRQHFGSDVVGDVESEVRSSFESRLFRELVN